MSTRPPHLLISALVSAMGAAASAQVVINEALENPPGGNDEFWEFVEFYGAPGMSLDGYALALLKGGNDTATDSQFRFVPGDINFDGRADVADLCAAAALLGATPDDTEQRTSDNETPDEESDDFDFDAWKFEGRAFNGLLMAANANDGDAVTLGDLAALQTLICTADWNADGAVNTQDVLAYLNAWNAQSPCADVNRDGAVDTRDFLAFLNSWNTGC